MNQSTEITALLRTGFRDAECPSEVNASGLCGTAPHRTPSMRHERPGNTLQTSALVNEAYVRLVDVHGGNGGTGRISWHFRRS